MATEALSFGMRRELPNFLANNNYFPSTDGLYHFNVNGVVDLIGLSPIAITNNPQKVTTNSFYRYSVYSKARGGATYLWDSSKVKSAHNGVTIISNTVPWAGTQATLAAFQAGTGESDPSGSGCWVMMLSGWLNVFCAGAVGNGSTDDTGPAQKCIDILEALGGGVVHFPSSSFKLTATLTVDSAGVYLMGDGWKSVLTRSTDYGHIVKFTGNDTTGVMLTYCGLLNMRIATTGATTSGASVLFNGVSYFRLQNTYVDQGFIGYQFDASGQGFVDNVCCIINNKYGGSSTGRRYMQFGMSAGAYSHPSSGGIWITNFQLRGPNPLTASQDVVEYGINIEGADGLWFANGHVGNTEKANYRLCKTTSELLALVYFTNAMSDEGAGVGIELDTVVARMIDIKFNNFTLKGATYATKGIHVKSTCDAYRVQFNGGSISEFKQQGVLIESTTFKRVQFNDVDVNGNSQEAPNTYDGYQATVNLTDVQWNGGCSGDHNVSPGSAGTQRYGMDFQGGSNVDVYVRGVNLKDNMTGSVSGTAVGTGAPIFTNCPSMGSTTIASATNLAVPISGTTDIFHVSGTNTITTVRTFPAGRKIKLIFDAICTVEHGTGNIKLKSGANLTTAAGTTLDLSFDGTNWYE